MNLKRLVRKFGTAKRDHRQSWQNSWVECLGVMLLTLTIAFFFTREYFMLQNDQLWEESFVLLRAEHFHRDRRHSEIDELYLYSVDGTKYIVEDSNILVSEIKTCMEVIQQGMQIDVLVASDGVRELIADGKMLLSREATAERAEGTAVIAIAVGIFMFIGSIAMAVRTAALFIKKRKGWNF